MPLGFKRWVDEHGQDHGRLEVGYMRQGLGFAYYEPVGDVDPDRGPEIGIFFEKRGYKTAVKEPTKGSIESWSPSVGDVYFYPWAEAFPGENTTKVGREIIQRRDLYDMWCYLMATDPDDVAERAEGLDEPGKMRRWAFYQIAAPWKHAELKKRAKKARKTGVNIEDVDMSESEGEDEGFEFAEEEQAERVRQRKRKRGDMPPPPRPSKKQKGKSGRAAASKTKRRRATNNDFMAEIAMSGGRGPGIGQISPSRESTGEPWFNPDPPSQHNIPRPVSGKKRARQHSVDDINGKDVDANAEIERLCHETDPQAQQQGLFDFGSQFGAGGFGVGRQPTAQHSPPWSSTGSNHLAAEINGGFDEDDALQRSLRESMEPDRLDDEQMNAMMRGSEVPDPQKPTGQTQNRNGDAEVDDSLGDTASANGITESQGRAANERSNSQQRANARETSQHGNGVAGYDEAVGMEEAGDDGGNAAIGTRGGGDGENGINSGAKSLENEEN